MVRGYRLRETRGGSASVLTDAGQPTGVARMLAEEKTIVGRDELVQIAPDWLLSGALTIGCGFRKFCPV